MSSNKTALLLDENMSVNKAQHAGGAALNASEPPEDKSGLIYLAMIILGAGTLFPYNTMMTAADYYEETWPGKDLIFWAPLASSLCTPFVQMAMIRLGGKLTLIQTLVLPFICNTILVVLLPLCPILVSNDSVSFILAVIFMLLIGFWSAVVQSTIFSLAAIFPPQFMQAVMAGQGWSGVAVSLARVITKASFPDDSAGYRNGAIVYFSLSALFTTFCIFVFLWKRATPFARFHLAAAGKDELAISDDALLHGALLDSAAPSAHLVHSTSAVAAEGTFAAGGNLAHLESGSDSDAGAGAQEPVEMKSVLKKLGFFPCHIICVFLMTFLVFPGLMTSPTTSFDMSQGWFALIMVCLFNGFDLLGRSLPAYVVLFSVDTVWLGVYLRFLLYPLFFLSVHSTIFDASSWWVLAFGAVFSLSNGYVSSLVMMFAPSRVAAHERGAAGGVMSMSLVSGILMGSLCSFGIQKITKAV